MDKTSIYTYFEMKKKLQSMFNLIVHNTYLYTFTHFFIKIFLINHVILYHFEKNNWSTI